MLAKHYAAKDVDELSRQYRASRIDYVQIEPGDLNARVQSVSTAKSELREACFDRAILNVIRNPVDFFGIALLTEGGVRLFGADLTNSNIRYVDGNNGVLARLDSHSSWCNLSVKQAFLQEVAQVHGYIIPTGDDSVGLPTNGHAALVSTFRQLMQFGARSSLTDEQLDDTLALLVLRALNPANEKATRNQPKSWVNVQEVIAYIEANYARPMTLTNLCQLVNVSERTLRYDFVKTTGMSPQKFLTNYRLQKARALLEGNKVAEVADAAKACGIPHTGRFSLYFKALFGESPGRVLDSSCRSIVA